MISLLLHPGEFSHQAGDSTVRDAHDLRRHRASREDNHRYQGGSRSHYRPNRGATKTRQHRKEDKRTHHPADWRKSPPAARPLSVFTD